MLLGLVVSCLVSFSAAWILACIFILLPEAWSLQITGYDCTAESANYTVFSLEDVAACPKVRDMEHRVNQTIQVLQTKQYLPTMVKQCRLRITRTIGYCGHFSRAAIPSSFFRHYTQILGKEKCEEVHRTRLFKYQDRFLMDNLKINSTTTFNFQLAGSANPDSICQSGTYHEDGIEYKYVQVQATIDILLVEYLAYARLDSPKPILQLHEDLTCGYEDSYCSDHEEGDIFWTVQPLKDCDKNTLDVLYEGPAELLISPGPYKGTNVTYVMVAQGQYLFALTLKDEVPFCHLTYHLTDQPRIKIMSPNHLGRFFFDKTELAYQNMGMMIYVNTKITYVARELKSDLWKVQADSVVNHCLQEREIMLSQLALIAADPHALPLLKHVDKGQAGIIAGDLLYLFSCAPVPVTVIPTELCYQHLPVSYKNETWYVHRRSEILLRDSPTVDCDPHIEVAYHVNGRWITGGKTIKVISAPAKLPVQDPIISKVELIHNLGDGGLYPSDAIHRLQSLLQFPFERQAIQENIVNRLTGRPHSGTWSSTNFFTPAELQSLADSTWNRIKGWFGWFGQFFSIIGGIYFTISVASMCLGSCFNAHALYRLRGWTSMLCLSCFPPVPLWVMAREMRRRLPNANVPQEEKVEPEPIAAPPQYPDVVIPPENPLNSSVVQSPHASRPVRHARASHHSRSRSKTAETSPSKQNGMFVV